MTVNHDNNKNVPCFVHLSDMEADSQAEPVQSSPGTGVDLPPPVAPVVGTEGPHHWTPGNPTSNPAPMPEGEGEEAAIPTTSDTTTRRSQRISHNTATGVWCSWRGVHAVVCSSMHVGILISMCVEQRCCNGGRLIHMVVPGGVCCCCHLFFVCHGKEEQMNVSKACLLPWWQGRINNDAWGVWAGGPLSRGPWAFKIKIIIIHKK